MARSADMSGQGHLVRGGGGDEARVGEVDRAERAPSLAGDGKGIKKGSARSRKGGGKSRKGSIRASKRQWSRLVGDAVGLAKSDGRVIC